MVLVKFFCIAAAVFIWPCQLYLLCYCCLRCWGDSFGSPLFTTLAPRDGIPLILKFVALARTQAHFIKLKLFKSKSKNGWSNQNGLIFKYHVRYAESSHFLHIYINFLRMTCFFCIHCFCINVSTEKPLVFCIIIIWLYICQK